MIYVLVTSGRAGFSEMRNESVLVDPDDADVLVIRHAPAPEPLPSEAIVQVAAISLNAGEVREALAGTVARPPGWDFSGVVLQAAADGSSPPKGARVVGIKVERGGWARQVAVASDRISEIPDDVSFAEAALLAGGWPDGTIGLERAGTLFGAATLIAGPTGGVGWFACQIARRSGAQVTALVRSGSDAEPLRALGFSDFLPSAEFPSSARRYDAVLEVVGGETLATALARLNEGGCVVSCGNASEGAASFQPRAFYLQSGVTLHGFFLLKELKHRSASAGLARLAEKVARRDLRCWIGHEASWRDISRVARAYNARELKGKVVLHIDA